MTKTIQFKDFPKSVIQKAMSERLKYQRNTRKVKENDKSGLKLNFSYK